MKTLEKDSNQPKQGERGRINQQAWLGQMFIKQAILVLWRTDPWIGELWIDEAATKNVNQYQGDLH